jgi:hypothetical protein
MWHVGVATLPYDHAGLIVATVGINVIQRRQHSDRRNPKPC